MPESKPAQLSINETDTVAELEEQLSVELTKKESFKEIFNFDKLLLMMERINEQEEENAIFKQELDYFRNDNLLLKDSNFDHEKKTDGLLRDNLELREIIEDLKKKAGLVKRECHDLKLRTDILE